ncbi:uncharacterized protein LOC128221794 [Mya arenaria]|uniref:uncharacterized protein LOC128221794 n=1 Tax=Mya arenaria TaxID=6604 RepID=UPI0022E4DB2C|nr:uncharacterized protein LOC128221794 [Mya arenaria]
MDRCCLLTLIFDIGLFGFACSAGNQYGTVSVVGPAFVNREVTLKMIPFFPWGCDVEWRCIREGSRTFQTMTGTKVERYSEDGSFFFKWIASIEYENADFYAVCSTNTSIGTSMVSLNMKGKQCQDNDIQTFSSIFRFPVKNLLIGTCVFCGLCIVLAIEKTDTSSDNDVVHITTEGVQLAVVQRQPATQRIGTQQPHNVDSLTYAELDINFLQEAHARVPSRTNDTRTEYADIEFHSTQTPAVEGPVYDNASV